MGPRLHQSTSRSRCLCLLPLPFLILLPRRLPNRPSPSPPTPTFLLKHPLSIPSLTLPRPPHPLQDQSQSHLLQQQRTCHCLTRCQTHLLHHQALWPLNQDQSRCGLRQCPKRSPVPARKDARAPPILLVHSAPTIANSATVITPLLSSRPLSPRIPLLVPLHLRLLLPRSPLLLLHPQLL